MTKRLDIGRRNLGSGQNDSMPAGDLEFPGWSRYWNARSRMAARRRRGFYAPNEYPNLSNGVSLAHFGGSGYATLPGSHSNYVTLGSYWTIDVGFEFDNNPSGTEPVVYGGPIKVYRDSGGTLHVVSSTTAGDVSMTFSLSGNGPFLLRVVRRDDYHEAYLNRETASDATSLSGAAQNTGNTYFAYDGSNYMTGDVFLFRAFNVPMSSTAGLSWTYPRPRDRIVLFNYYGNQITLPGSGKSAIMDYGPGHMHALITGSVSESVTGLITVAQEAAVAPSLNQLYVVVDGNLVQLEIG